jgi:hypothetical protein
MKGDFKMNGYNVTPIKTILITSATTTSTGVIFIPSETITAYDLINLDKYRMILSCNVRPTANLPIYIQTETGLIPLFCRYASNNIFPDQLKRRYCYTVVYGNNNVYVSLGQFVLQNSVCATSGKGTTGNTKNSAENSTETVENTTEVVRNAKSK